MGFSAEWLALREPVDHRSRASALAEKVSIALAGRDPVRVVDLGCGTGSNLRATAPLLGEKQEWTLVDYDFALLEAAARTLTDWADHAKAIGDQLVIEKDGKVIGIRFRIADLNRELEDVLSGKPDLVTASALFDLISEGWMKGFISTLKASGAAFYTVLTYNGEDDFRPSHPFDEAVIRAFSVHQRRDKGFGPAAGPKAAAVLAKLLNEGGFTVETANSPWIMKLKDAPLVMELLKGMKRAVEETGFVAEAGLNDWLNWRIFMAEDKQTRMLTGHTDIFAKAK